MLSAPKSSHLEAHHWETPLPSPSPCGSHNPRPHTGMHTPHPPHPSVATATFLGSICSGNMIWSRLDLNRSQSVTSCIHRTLPTSVGMSRPPPLTFGYDSLLYQITEERRWGRGRREGARVSTGDSAKGTVPRESMSVAGGGRGGCVWGVAAQSVILLRDSRLAALLLPETSMDLMMHLLTLASHLLRNIHLMQVPSGGSWFCSCKLGPLTTAGSHRVTASSPRGTCPCPGQYLFWLSWWFCSVACLSRWFPIQIHRRFLLFTAVMVHNVAVDTELAIPEPWLLGEIPG